MGDIFEEESYADILALYHVKLLQQRTFFNIIYIFLPKEAYTNSDMQMWVCPLSSISNN